MSTALLTTKLYIPARSGKFVTRERLIRQLEAGVRGKLTLISAPAGFGKTTLIKSWLEHSPHRAAWLSLDPADNTLTRFWAYVIAALQQIETGIGSESLETLSQSINMTAIEPLLTPLMNDLAALTAPLILVLDDFHLIEEPLIHDSLGFLLEHQPPALHLVLTTRKDPMLPLAKLRARRELIELRAGDLRFTEEETARFIHEVMGMTLSADNIRALELRTEGWAAGLQMAALSMQHLVNHADFIAAFTGSNRYIMDYLIDEVLSQQPPDIQDFLLQTSILDRLCGPLCDAVVSDTVSQQILEQLERSNLFLVSLDDHRTWYRYHSLFADLLRHHLNRSGVDVAALHQRASQWYEQQGYIEEALRHALHAEDIRRAVRLVEQNYLPVSIQSRWNVLADWLRLLPRDVIQTRPRLLLLEAWIYMAQFQLEMMAAKNQQVLALLKSGDHDVPDTEVPIMQAEIDIMTAAIMVWQGEAAHAVQILEQAREILAARADAMMVVAENTLAIASLVVGNWKRARAALAAAEAKAAAGPFWQLSLAYLHELRGSLHEAIHAYHTMLKYLDDTNLMVNVALNYLGRLYYEANDLTTAEKYLNDALRFGHRNNIPRILVEGNVFISQVYQAQGRTLEAMRAAQEAVIITETYLPFPVGDFARGNQAALWLNQGKIKQAAEWLNDCRLEIGAAPLVFLEIEWVLRARVLLAVQKPRDALVILEKLLPVIDQGGRLTTLMRIRALQGLAYLQLGELPTALLMMRETLSLARGGYVRFFVDEREPMAYLLRECVKHGIEADYAAHLLTFFEAPHVQAELVEPLTERELEILRLLEERWSNQEIAQKLTISPTTVKKHTGNIYGKLDVRSRREAVAKAKSLGLLR